MFQTKVAEKIKTHTGYYIQKLVQNNRAVYEIMWTNYIEPDRPQVTI